MVTLLNWTVKETAFQKLDVQIKRIVYVPRNQIDKKITEIIKHRKFFYIGSVDSTV